MKFMYISILLVSLLCMAYIDYAEGLALWNTRLRGVAVRVLVYTVAFFLLWDITGVVAGIFATNQKFVVGIHIATHNLPIEEFFFLGLMAYTTLVLSAYIQRKKGSVR